MRDYVHISIYTCSLELLLSRPSYHKKVSRQPKFPMERSVLLLMVCVLAASGRCRYDSGHHTGRGRRDFKFVDLVAASGGTNNTDRRHHNGVIIPKQLSNSIEPLYNQWFQKYEDTTLPVVRPRFGYAAARLVYEPPSASLSQQTELLAIHGGQVHVSHSGSGLYAISTEVSDEIQFFTFNVNTGVQASISVDRTDGFPGRRHLHTAVSFPEFAGRPIVFYGGLDENTKPLGSTWLLGASGSHRQGLRWTQSQTGTERYGHSAVGLGTLMLVFGGCNVSSCFNDVQVYDLELHTWTPVRAVGSVPTPRGGHSAIAVQQAHRMFIHGGMDMAMSSKAFDVYGETYAFDLTRNLWEVLLVSPPSTTLTITHAASTFLEHSNRGHWIIYGVVSKSFDEFGVAVSMQLRIQLSDGSPQGTWTVRRESDFVQFPKSRMMASFVNFKTKVGDQVAYMIGGTKNVKTRRHVFYDPLAEVWVLRQDEAAEKYEWMPLCALSGRPAPRAGHTVTALASGQLAFFGGAEQEFSSFTTFARSDVWELSMKQGELEYWTDNTPTIRSVEGVVGHASVAVAYSTAGQNGSIETGAELILSFGGLRLASGSLDNSIILVATRLLYWNVWSPGENQPQPCPRAFHSLILHNSTLYLFGGISNTLTTSALNDTWSLQWTGTAKQPPEWRSINAAGFSPGGRFGHSATAYYFGNIDEFVMLIYGGTNGTEVYGDLWMLPLSTLTWKQLEPCPLSSVVGTDNAALRVFGHSASMVGLQMVVYGGCGDPPIDRELTVGNILPECPRGGVSYIVASYNTERGTWSIVDMLEYNVPRYFHTSVFIDGYLFVHGGFSDEATIYDGLDSVRVGCSRGYEGNFENGSCVQCPKGSYGAGGGEACQKCDSHFTTEGQGKFSKDDCSVCRNEKCNGNGYCKLDENNKFACRCKNWVYEGTYCQAGWRIGTFAGGVCLLVVLLVLLLRHKKKNNDLKIAKKERETALLLATKFTNTSFVIEWDDLKVEEEIGHGGYGTVSRATLRDNIPVAVKQVSSWKLDPDDAASGYNSLMKEIEHISKLRHRNIALFQGAGHKPDVMCLFLLTELAEPGSLHRVLHEKEKGPDTKENSTSVIVHLEPRTKLEFCRDISSALTYLQEKKYFHRDLKPMNVLVSLSGRAKIIDFGVTTKVKETSKLQEMLEQEQQEQPNRPLETTGRDLEDDSKKEMTSSGKTTVGNPTRNEQSKGPATEVSPLLVAKSDQTPEVRALSCQRRRTRYSAPEVIRGKYTKLSDFYRYVLVRVLMFLSKHY